MAAYHLFGGCSCERNQYVIAIPPSSSAQAQVFFDNSATSRRAQATPITAWLRVPLDWYQSATYAQFDNESHSSIKKTYNTPSSRASIPPTRRQFCGYCGTTLTAWNEALHAGGYGSNTSDLLDVTLGSLLNESLDKLEALKIMPDSDTEEESPQSPQTIAPQVPDARIATRQHVAPDGSQHFGVPVRAAESSSGLHRMSDRGVPYFEEMIEHSRLGRIRRQIGGHASCDGSSSVQWEVVETIIGDAEPSPSGSSSPNKRQRLDL
ncbi:hypothetical protein Slin15195_G024400 [Septoria linicola]|uniref:CENP-V/GFA domain-containing protein n=1 Tax=Septoria linicola TaxID=215465 RepID=A0A9Q9AQU5_9PEZI|nr:hypothetical protein Slin14017_G023490 [Septoria linicola]USW49121.1 hypothetical protein Slin15195_G024400 [Septoria linicola]